MLVFVEAQQKMAGYLRAVQFNATPANITEEVVPIIYQIIRTLYFANEIQRAIEARGIFLEKAFPFCKMM